MQEVAILSLPGGLLAAQMLSRVARCETNRSSVLSLLWASRFCVLSLSCASFPSMGLSRFRAPLSSVLVNLVSVSLSCAPLSFQLLSFLRLFCSMRSRSGHLYLLRVSLFCVSLCFFCGKRTNFIDLRRARKNMISCCTVD